MGKPQPAATPADTLYIAGAKNIGRVLGRSTKSVFHLLESGQLPARKVGGVWTLDMRAFAASFQRDESVSA
jgi:hypothetical protein